MAKTDPTHEAKSTTQYSKEGFNLRELLAQQGGGDRASFDNLLKNSGISRRDMRRLGKAYDTIQNSNLDYIVSEDGTGFNVFDKTTGAAQTRSSRGAGNTKGVNLADLVQLGDNVSKLAGFASRGIAESKKAKEAPAEAAAAAMKTSDVNTGDAEVDLVNYKPTTTTKGKGKVQTGNVKTPVKNTADPTLPPTPQINAKFEEALKRYQEGNNPNRFRGVDENKMAEHLKAVRGQFMKSLNGVGTYVGNVHPPTGYVPDSVIQGNASPYADRATAIYEQMVREGYEPDIQEISNLVINDELEQVSKATQGSMTAIQLIPLARLGTWGIKGGVAGMRNLATKYPKFAKWLASKGVAKPLQFPPSQQLPSVTGGAKRFLSGQKPLAEGAKRMKYEGMPVDKPSKFNWDWMNERVGDGFGRGGRIPMIADANQIGLNSAMNSQVHRYVSQTWNPREKKVSFKSLMGK